MVELRVGEDKSLTVHEKEPFYWLSILQNLYGSPTRNRT